MYDNDFSNLGRQIQETVQNAVESMNYDRLNQTINQTVNQALDEARIYKEKVRRQYEESQKRQAENLKKQCLSDKLCKTGREKADQYGACAEDQKRDRTHCGRNDIEYCFGCGDYRSAGYKDLFRDGRYSKPC